MQISQSSPYASYNAYTPTRQAASIDSDADTAEGAGSASAVNGRSGRQQEAGSAQSSTGVEKKADGTPLSDQEQQELDELKARDREVRTHEQAHLSAAGQYATSGASFSYTQGPDGRKYATAGEVHIDTSEVSGDAEATINKMQQVYRSALAPQEPSTQDRRVAAKATAAIAKARSEVASGEDEEEDESAILQQADPAQRRAADAYAGMQNNTTSTTGGLQLAV